MTTVKELIEKLKEYPEDMRVLIEGGAEECGTLEDVVSEWVYPHRIALHAPLGHMSLDHMYEDEWLKDVAKSKDEKQKYWIHSRVEGIECITALVLNRPKRDCE